MKKFFKLLLLCVAAMSLSCLFSPQALAASESDSDVYRQLSDSVQSCLDKLDMSGMEEYLDLLGEDGASLFGEKSFADKVNSVLNGSFAEEGGFLKSFFQLFFGELFEAVPLLAGIAVVAILCGLVSQMRSGIMSESTKQIVFFVCFALVVVLTLLCATNLINVAKNTVGLMKGQMNVALPILLTLMAGVGGTVSVKAYQPAVALLSGAVVEIVSNIILPLFIFTLVFSVVSNLSENVKLGKLTDFFKSASTTLLAVTFTVFTAFLSIQGLTAGTFDSVSIRAAKFATKSYVPILGGYLADGFDLILASGVLIKNSVGVAGLLLLVCTIAMPIIEILSICIGLKLVAAIVEPVTDGRITAFLSGVSKNLKMLIVSILAVAFMYFICVMLLIFTSNAFF